jgi:hypothetical protein
MPTGRLKVHVQRPEPWLRQPINIIDGQSLQLVAATECNEEIEVPAGTYFVSATLPSGERSVGVAEVASGELSELELGVAKVAADTPSASASAALAPPVATLESLGPATRVPAPPPPPPAPAPAAKGTWFVRFHIQTPERGFEPANPQVQVTSVSAERCELTISASGNGILFAQTARPGDVPLNVALPIYGPTISQSCRLTLALSDSKLTADVSLPENPEIDAVARFLNGGHVQEAARVSGDAEHLLQQKMADPFGAALGGYALLRAGQLDRLHHWPRNLADSFPWLPDGAVIAGEEAALEGDHAVAITYVCEAARRGLPVFGPGFSLLAARLREYSGAPETAFGRNGKLVAEVGKLLEGVLAVMPFVDFARVSLGYHGADIGAPATSQTPFAAPAEGWRDLVEI